MGANTHHTTITDLWGFYDDARIAGEQTADKELSKARRRAEAKAMKLLAAKECPNDLLEWGIRNKIPEFAKMTWQAGFEAGMRAALLEQNEDV